MRRAALGLVGLLAVARFIGPENFGHLVAKVLVIPIASAIALLPAWKIACFVAERTQKLKVDPVQTSEPGRAMAPLIMGFLAGVPVFILTNGCVWTLLQSFF